MTLSYRKDLRCAHVSRQEAARILYEEHKFDWFEEGSWNTIVLIWNDKTIAWYELETAEYDMKLWLTDLSLHPLNEMTLESEAIMKKVKRPTWLFFLSLDEKSDS